MRLIEAAVFLSVAASAHVGLWAVVPAPHGASSAGDQGTEAATVAPASAAMAALAQAWETPPETVTDIAMPRVETPVETAPPSPTAEAPTMTAALPNAPQFDMAAPVLPAKPDPTPPVRPQTEMAQPTQPEVADQDVPHRQTDTRPAPAAPQQLAAVTPPPTLPQMDQTTPDSTSKRPVLRPRELAPTAKAKPAPKPKPKTTASVPQAKSTAKGTARTSATAGTGGAAQTQSVSAARANALQAQWGAAIQSKVRRNATSPRGAGAGRTKLALSIAPSGVLESVRVVASSGNATLDQAALSAVKRARRFARAPKGLTKPAYTFTIALDFNG
jgi:protein TonB